MTQSMVKHLIVKDWQLNGKYLIAYILAGFFAAFLFGIPGRLTFYTGMVLLISVLATAGIHMVFGAVLSEQKNQTQAFILSLPVSPGQYTKAKIIANLSMTLTVWLLVLAAIYLTVYSRDHIPLGLLPFITISVFELLVAYVLILAFAIVSGSEIATIVVMTLCNISISIFMFWLSSFEGINRHIEGHLPVWNQTAVTFVTIELALIAVLIALTFYLQSKKTRFI